MIAPAPVTTSSPPVLRLLLSLAMLAASALPPLAAQEDLQQTNAFVESRYKFDRYLRSKSTQPEIDTLCDQYRGSLENLLGGLQGRSPYLASCVAAEIERIASVQDGYLADRSAFARVRLDHYWMNSLTHKEAVADFRKVLGVSRLDAEPTERPDIRGDFGKDAKLLGLPWLVHVDEIKKRFRQQIKSQVGSKVPVGMPGFPKDSFFHVAFDGEFTDLSGFGFSRTDERKVVSGTSALHLEDVGEFNRMNVVVDALDQAVAVQFTCEHPKRAPSVLRSDDLGIFNFVQFRRKAIRTAVTYKSERFPEFHKITTVLKTQDGRLLEVGVLHLPNPTVELTSYALSFPVW